MMRAFVVKFPVGQLIKIKLLHNLLEKNQQMYLVSMYSWFAPAQPKKAPAKALEAVWSHYPASQEALSDRKPQP